MNHGDSVSNTVSGEAGIVLDCDMSSLDDETALSTLHYYTTRQFN